MITIKDIEGNTRLTMEIGEGSIGKYTLGKEDYVTLNFSLAEPVYFKIGDYTDLTGVLDESLGGKLSKVYEVTDVQSPTYNTSTGGYDYELRLDAYYMKWKNKIFKYENEASWNLTAGADVHLEQFVQNLKVLGYTFSGSAFTYSVDSTVEDAAKLVSYDNTNLIDALTMMAETWECDWWVTENVIHLGRCESGSAVTFEIGVQATDMTRSESKGTFATRLYAFGSTRNITTNYRPSSSNVVQNGVVQKRLMLPSGISYIDAYRYVDGKRIDIGEEGYEKGTEMPTEEAVEGVIVNDSIYPRTTCKVGEVGSYTSTTTDEETGETITQTFYYVTDTSSLVFDEDYILEGYELRMVFQSGSLNGMDFGVTFRKAGTYIGETLLTADVYEIVANDDYGRTLPDDTLKPAVGDTFVLYNWDSTKIEGMGLVTEAEEELYDYAKDYIKKTMVDDGTYTTTLRSDWVYEDQINRTYDIGQKVNLINNAFFDDGRLSRIIGFELKLDIPYDSPVYMVGESTTYSRLGALEDSVDSLTYKGQTYTGSGGSSIYVIRTNDTTAPSNTNVYSALRSLDTFLRKDKDDETAYSITTKKAFQVGNFVSGSSGAILYEDSETKQTTGELDRLYVRIKAYFEELEIVNVNSVGGRQIITPGGAVKLYDVWTTGTITVEREKQATDEDGNLLYDENGDPVMITYEEEIPNGVPEDVYRCFFLAEQEGEEIENRFHAGDQAFSQDFNVAKAGLYQKVANHYYWRLVKEVSTDPVEVDGYQLHYIDLSITDYDTGSDAPAKGDTVVQLGNREDTNRQNAIIFSSVDSFSPSITLYEGIDSYSFTDKDVVSFGVDKTTGKAFFNVYGEMYVGDRDNTTYVKYTQDGGVEIKGQLEVGTKIGDGRTIEEALDDTEEAAVKEAQTAVDEVKETVNNLDKTVDSMRDFTDEAFADGIIDRSEAVAIADYIKIIETTQGEVEEAYGEVYSNELLTGTAKTNLENAYSRFIAATTDLVNAINSAIEDGVITDVERATVNTAYDNFNGYYAQFTQCLNAAIASIMDVVNARVDDAFKEISSYAYLKAALAATEETTTIEGGLILSSLIALGYTDENKDYHIMSGTNGEYDASEPGGGIASWWGGEMIDKEYYPEMENAATAIIRMDGTGYFASGALWWDATGRIHADPQSFLIDEDQIGDYLQLFQIIYRDTEKTEISYVIPQYLFDHLDIANYLLIGGETGKSDEEQGVKISKINDGVLYIDGDLVVKGYVTMYAQGSEYTPSTLLDALPIDENTLSKEGGVLSVIGGSGINGIIVNGSTYTPVNGYITLPDYSTGSGFDGIIVNGSTYTPVSGYVTLPDYVTPSSLNTTLADYVTSSSLSTILGDYVTSAALSSELGNYVTQTSLNTTLGSYVTNTALSTELSNYVTSSALTTTLADYVTNTSLNTTLSSYVTNTALATELGNYVTIATAQTITGLKTFTGGTGLNIGSVNLYEVNEGVVYIKGDLVVKGYVTMYADDGSTYTASTLLDLLPIDENTLSKDGGVLSVIGGGSGIIGINVNGSTYTPVNGYITLPDYSSAWDDITGKPSWLSSTVGSTTQPVYINAGTPTVCSSTVGGTARPVYMNAGTITALSASVGSSTLPVYMSSGTITACTYTLGATINSGTSGTLAYYSGTNAISSYTSTVGGAAKPIYLSSGVPTACSSTVGSTDIPVYMNNGAITSTGIALSSTYMKWRQCYVGQSAASTVNPWYKFASIEIIATYRDETIVFKVNESFSTRYNNCGILQAHVRTGPTAGTIESAQLYWEYANDRVSLGKFVLAYKADSSNGIVYVELWVKIDANYVFYQFTVLSEMVRTQQYNTDRWTLYTLSSSTGSEAEITSGYTQIESTAGVLLNPATQLGTSTVGGTAQPIYLNAGTATACSSTVGSATLPVYMSSGTITQCTASSLFSELSSSSSTNLSVTVAGQSRTISELYAKYLRMNASTDLENNILKYATLNAYSGLAGNTDTDGAWGGPEKTSGASFNNGQVVRLMYSDSKFYHDIYFSPNVYKAADGIYFRQIANNAIQTGSYTGGWRLLIDSYNYVNLVEQLGTSTVGGTAKPIYLNAGTATACSSTVGSSTLPVYMSSGTITVCGTSLAVDITGNAASASQVYSSTSSSTLYLLGVTSTSSGNYQPYKNSSVYMNSGTLYATNLITTGYITMYYTSDRRQKANIREVTDAGKRLLNLGKVYDFDYKDTAKEKVPYLNNHTGFMYQDVIQSELSCIAKEGSDGYGSINYIDPSLISLVCAVGQEHETRIERLEKENKQLKRRIKELERRAA